MTDKCDPKDLEADVSAEDETSASLYEAEQLLKLWKLEELSLEQAIGQLILRVVSIIKIMVTIQRRLFRLEQRLDNLE